MQTSRSLLSFSLLLSGVLAPLPHPAQNPAPSLESGRRAYEASQYDQAAELLQKAAGNEPQNAEILSLLTKTYLEMQRLDSAIQSAERAVALAPQNSEYHHWLGKAYGEKADRASWFSAFSLAKKLRKEFETAVQLDQRNFAAQQDLIEFYCSAPGIVGGGEDKAETQVAALAAMDSAEGHFAKGNCLRHKKDFTAADREFDLALAAGAKSSDLIYDIGDYAMKHNQPARLLAVSDAGQKANPADPRGDFYRATAFILRGEKFAEAERLLRAYLHRAPNRSAYPRPWASHEWLGRLFEQQGKAAPAETEYRTALQLDPKNKAAREALQRLGKGTTP
jgi:tetratricopeptide (TPR) repeat protein